MNPLKRKEFYCKLAVVTLLLGLWLLNGVSLVVEGIGDGRLRLAMELAMSKGSPDATTWIGMRFPKEDPGLLERQAVKGEPQAMYLVGMDWIKRGDRAKGTLLIHQAAVSGYPLAVKYEVGHHSSID